MNTKEISGRRQMEFLTGFDFVREAGTAGEVKAAKMIRDTLDSFGVKNRMEEFDFWGFRINRAVLKVVEPYQKEYVVTGYGRCGNTGAEGLKADFLYVENGDAVSLSRAKGKIVMVNGRVSGDVYQRLVSAGAVGFISVEGSPLDEGVDRVPCQRSLPMIFPGNAEGEIEGLSESSEDIHEMQEKYSGRIPGANLHYKDAVELVTEGAAVVCLAVEQEVTACTSRNVVARIEGTDKKDEILTLTAHYDSVPEGPGAYDNMAGAAIIMELCRYFQQYRPRRTMEFVWFGAEEKGLLGSRDYIRVHESELGAHRFNMNVDLAGQLIGGNVLGVTGEASVCDKLLEIADGAYGQLIIICSTAVKSHSVLGSHIINGNHISVLNTAFRYFLSLVLKLFLDPSVNHIIGYGFYCVIKSQPLIFSDGHIFAHIIHGNKPCVSGGCLFAVFIGIRFF